MAYTLTVLPEAREDIDQSEDWYEAQSVGLGLRFYQTQRRAMLGICDHPFGFEVYKGRIRRRVERTFHFNIYYLVEEESVVILAVWHQHRNPADLNDRLAPFA